jgi:hypothetical protein
VKALFIIENLEWWGALRTPYLSIYTFVRQLLRMKLSIIFPMLFVVLGVIIFSAGHHAVDTSWNMKSIESTSDINYFGRVVDYNTLYMQGNVMLLIGLAMSVFSALFVGVRNDA